jgi:hypothetical protein
MNPILRRPNGILMAVSLALATLLSALTTADREAGAAAAPPTLARIETTLVDGATILAATFQSNNQKVVANARGIFMTHLRTRNEPYTAQTWRLSWSRDGGKSFATLHEATHATNPPILETDAQNNLYLVRMDFTAGDAYLYRFLSADDYADSKITRIPRGAAGKYAMVLDPGRRRLYYFAHNGTFHILDLGGALLRTYDILQAGKNAALQYPLLCMDTGGALYAAWTTVKHGVYLYWDIHAIRSRDGGETWQKLDGTPLTLPILADDTGPTDRISADDEFEVHTWLSSFLARDGKLHFLYLAQSKPSRQHYVRYDLRSGRRDLDLSPQFKGQTIRLEGLASSPPPPPAAAVSTPLATRTAAASAALPATTTAPPGTTTPSAALSRRPTPSAAAAPSPRTATSSAPSRPAPPAPRRPPARSTS